MSQGYQQLLSWNAERANPESSGKMLQVADQYRIRQAYYIEKKSQREIAREFGYSRNTIKKAIEQDEGFQYRRQQPAPAPVLGPYKERLQELVAAIAHYPQTALHRAEDV